MITGVSYVEIDVHFCFFVFAAWSLYGDISDCADTHSAERGFISVERGIIKERYYGYTKGSCFGVYDISGSC